MDTEAAFQPKVLPWADRGVLYHPALLLLRHVEYLVKSTLASLLTFHLLFLTPEPGWRRTHRGCLQVMKLSKQDFSEVMRAGEKKSNYVVQQILFSFSQIPDDEMWLSPRLWCFAEVSPDVLANGTHSLDIPHITKTRWLLQTQGRLSNASVSMACWVTSLGDLSGRRKLESMSGISPICPICTRAQSFGDTFNDDGRWRHCSVAEGKTWIEQAQALSSWSFMQARKQTGSKSTRCCVRWGGQERFWWSGETSEERRKRRFEWYIHLQAEDSICKDSEVCAYSWRQNQKQDWGTAEQVGGVWNFTGGALGACDEDFRLWWTLVGTSEQDCVLTRFLF